MPQLNKSLFQHQIRQNMLPNFYKEQNQLINCEKTQTITEIIDSVVESNIHTIEEAKQCLTLESIAEIYQLLEINSIENNATEQLNWLIVVGTHSVSQHLGTFVIAISKVKLILI